MAALIRIAIVDDHKLVADALATALQPSHLVIGTAQGAADALRLVSEKQPDVILLDISLGHENGLELIPQFKTVAPGAKAIVITMYGTTGFQEAARRLGARGFISKAESAAALSTAIEIVRGGGEAYSPANADLGAIPSSVDPRIHVTPRQLQVLQHLARGRTYKEISQAMAISEYMVDLHLRHLRVIFHEKRSIKLVQMAKDHGFLDS